MAQVDKRDIDFGCGLKRCTKCKRPIYNRGCRTCEKRFCSACFAGHVEACQDAAAQRAAKKQACSAVCDVEEVREEVRMSLDCQYAVGNTVNVWSKTQGRWFTDGVVLGVGALAGSTVFGARVAFDELRTTKEIPQDEIDLILRPQTQEPFLIFMSHTKDKEVLSKAIEGAIQQVIPHAKFWDMSRIPAGAGCVGEPRFNEQIMENVRACKIMVGILDAKCAGSNPRWGCPAEWKMGLEAGKRVIVLDLYEESAAAKQNPQVKALMKKLQFQDLNERPSMFKAVMHELVSLIKQAMVGIESGV